MFDNYYMVLLYSQPVFHAQMLDTLQKSTNNKEWLKVPRLQTSECSYGRHLDSFSIQLLYDGVLTFLRPRDRKFIRSRAPWEGRWAAGEGNVGLG